MPAAGRPSRSHTRANPDETLYRWHCRCGYANVGYDPCFGCHCRAPRQVRANTVAHPPAPSPVDAMVASAGSTPPSRDVR